MRAVVATEPGGPEALRIVDRPDLTPDSGEVTFDVVATAVNRADLLQRKGLYPPPEGVTEVLGLEAAGVVSAVGAGVTRWQVGDEICALLPGGGYAEQAVVPAALAMPLPPGVATVEAAAVPEVFATAYDNLLLRGRLAEGETALIHGGASGVGTAAIQLAKRSGCRVLVTAGSAERVERCVALGADGGVVYHDTDWSKSVLEHTDGKGVDVVLDIVGGPYLRPNISCLATEGRLVIIGLMGGAKAEINLGVLLSKRISVMGSTLRARTTAEKEPLMNALVSEVWPGFGDGSLRPIVDRVVPFAAVADAHVALEHGDVFGKIVLAVSEP